jgi:hypothetical protein
MVLEKLRIKTCKSLLRFVIHKNTASTVLCSFFIRKNIKADIEDACLMHLANSGSILLCLTVTGESLRKCKH